MNINTLKEMQAIAVDRGGVCLSKKYINSKTHLHWRCKKGHTWFMSPTKITSGYWCKQCRKEETLKKRNAEKFNQVKAIAKSHAGTCVSKEYTSLRTALTWRCANGHEWQSSPEKILNGRWCKTCRDRNKVTRQLKEQLEAMQQKATIHGGKCLSNTYRHVQFPLQWQCRNGHTWNASAQSVKQGRWCKQCDKVEHLNEKLSAVISANKGGCLTPAQNIQKETDTIHMTCQYGHEWNTTVINILQGTWCVTCGYLSSTESNRIYTYERFCMLVKGKGGRVNSKKSEFKNAQSKVTLQCGKKHEWTVIAKRILDGRWCPHCSKSKKKTLEDMQEIAASHGGECLSTEYINGNHELEWRCEEGHTWKAKYRSAKTAWCRICKHNTNVKKINRPWNKYTIETLSDIAHQRGWKLLSKQYKDVVSPLKWQCEYGHLISISARRIMKYGSCPTCKPYKFSVKDMRQLAREHGGKFLSESYTNSHEKYRWRCAEGHEWQTTAASILQGSWCRICRNKSRA